MIHLQPINNLQLHLKKKITHKKNTSKNDLNNTQLSRRPLFLKIFVLLFFIFKVA